VRAQLLADELGYTVQTGPLEGLRFPKGDLSHVDALMPKLLGTYEQELCAAIQRVLSREPTHFIDFGAAEGYYAVGVALKTLSTRVLAYDLAPSARAACRTLAEENQVAARVEQRGRARLTDLSAGELRDAFLMSDIEGQEMDLFSEEVLPRLVRTTLIIEAHETLRPGVSKSLLARFADSHDADVVDVTYPRPPLFGTVSQYFAPEDLADVMYEGRPSARWMILEPRAR
jgi:hypothetical protein